MTATERQRHENIIFRLLKAAEGLACGRQFQVTRFYHLSGLCTGADGFAFVVALLARVRKEVKSSGTSPLIPLAEKLKLLDEAVAAFTAIPENERSNWLMVIRDQGSALAERLYSLQPGWERIWVHAFRRRAKDKELLLAEVLLKGLLQDAIALFLTSYERYRYHLLPDAAERVRWIAGFWCNVLLNEEVETCAERMRSAPITLKPRRTPAPRARRLARAQGVMARRPASESEMPAPVELKALPIELPPPFVLSNETITRLNELEATLREKGDHDEFDDPAEEKLSRAHYNLVKAWRLFRDNNDPGQVTTRLKGAKNRCCEAWLLRNGHIPSDHDNRDSMASLFYARGPAMLLRKALILEQKLTNLFYGNIHIDQVCAGREAPSLERRSEIAACLGETLAFYEHLRDGCPLPLIRWERETGFAPGQWVLKSEIVLVGWDEHGQAFSRRNIIPYQVAASTERGVVVRQRNERSMTKFFAGTLSLWPTAMREDLSSPPNQRRLWFDVRPQLRQVPLDLPYILGIGKSVDQAADFSSALYETCPCCGYPVKMSQRSHLMLQSSVRLRRRSCVICDWVDRDGLDSMARRPVNFGYSLIEARENFTAFGSIFRPEDGEDFKRHQSEEVKRLKEPLRATFDAMIGERNHGRLFLLWWQAEGLRRELLERYDCLDGIEPVSSGDPSLIEAGIWIDALVDRESLVIAVYYDGYSSAVLRIRNHKGKNREISADLGLKILPRPRINIWTPFFARRTWFECYPEFLRGNLPCPCCGYPTLRMRGVLEYCPLCHWRDDGQDDHDADQVSGGPNGDYSLTGARRNFAETLAAFRSEDAEKADRELSGPVYRGLKKKRLAAFYDRLILAEDAGAAERLWSEIDECRQEDTGARD